MQCALMEFTVGTTLIPCLVGMSIQLWGLSMAD